MSVAAPTLVASPAVPPGLAAMGHRWGWALRMAAVASLLGAEVIHALTIGTHRDWAAAGVFFAVIAVAEGLLGVGVLVAPSRRLYGLTLGMSAATVAVWLVSRTTGLPVGPARGVPLAIGTADSISTFLEVLTVAALLPLVTTSGSVAPAASAARNRAAGAAAAAVIILLTTLAVSYPEPVARQGHHAVGAPRPARRALIVNLDG